MHGGARVCCRVGWPKCPRGNGVHCQCGSNFEGRLKVEGQPFFIFFTGVTSLVVGEPALKKIEIAGFELEIGERKRTTGWKGEGDRK